MSHIGKKPIQIPLDIKISYNKLSIKITGPLGSLSLELPNKIECVFKTSPSPELYVLVKENNLSKQNRKNISEVFHCPISRLVHIIWSFLIGL